VVPLHPRHYSSPSNNYTECIITPPYQYRWTPYHIHAPLSQCRIPRRLQDTSTLKSSLGCPYPSIHDAGLISINTNGVVTAYMHSYNDTGPAPSQCHALGHDTNPLSLLPRYRPPHFGYMGRLLYLHSLTSTSAVSHGYYKQIRPIGVDPDPTPTLFLSALVAQPSAMEYWSSQYWSFSCTQGTVSGWLYPSLLLDLQSWQVGSTSLQDEVC
jgi:hypothetical protein